MRIVPVSCDSVRYTYVSGQRWVGNSQLVAYGICRLERRCLMRFSALTLSPLSFDRVTVKLDPLGWQAGHI